MSNAMFVKKQRKRYSFYKPYVMVLGLGSIGLVLSIVTIIIWIISHEDYYPLFFSVILFGLSADLLLSSRNSCPRDWNVVFFNEETIQSKQLFNHRKTTIHLTEQVYYVTMWRTLAFEQIKVVLLSNNPIDINEIIEKRSELKLEKQIMIVSNTLQNEFVPLDEWVNQGTLY